MNQCLLARVTYLRIMPHIKGHLAHAAHRGPRRVEAGRGGQLDGAAAQPHRAQGVQLWWQHRLLRRHAAG